VGWFTEYQRRSPYQDTQERGVWSKEGGNVIKTKKYEKGDTLSYLSRSSVKPVFDTFKIEAL